MCYHGEASSSVVHFIVDDGPLQVEILFVNLTPVVRLLRWGHATQHFLEDCRVWHLDKVVVLVTDIGVVVEVGI